MIGQYLSNTNESATIPILQNFLKLNNTSDHVKTYRVLFELIRIIQISILSTTYREKLTWFEISTAPSISNLSTLRLGTELKFGSH